MSPVLMKTQLAQQMLGLGIMIIPRESLLLVCRGTRLIASDIICCAVVLWRKGRVQPIGLALMRPAHCLGYCACALADALADRPPSLGNGRGSGFLSGCVVRLYRGLGTLRVLFFAVVVMILVGLRS
jgi:hypothetical protein